MNYFRQIWYEMRHQKMMTWVSVSATALSIFLVMAFYMTEQAKVMEVAPETNRSRISTGKYVELIYPEKGWSSSGGISYDMAKRLYGDLKGVEKIAYATCWNDTYNVGIKGKKTIGMSVMKVDENFWNLYDFRFLHGKPFGKPSVESGEKIAVVTRNVARRTFDKDDVVGEEILMQHVPYTICGVVDNISPLLVTTVADIFLPLGSEMQAKDENGISGNIQALLLLSDDCSNADLQKQVESRYKMANAVFKKEGKDIVYHGQPYDMETLAYASFGSNNTPDLSSRRSRVYMIYIVLLLLPAINLSSMTRSRLRRRVSEIGVRRAFGAKRFSIVCQMLGENFLLTAIGGLVGLLISLLFMVGLYDVFFPLSESSMLSDSSNPTFSMLFTWDIFLVALLFCFVLNLLSAFLPAWKASRVEPAVAIAKSKQ